MKVEYDPRAVSDLNHSVDYYNRQRSGLGDELRSEVYSAIDRVCASPTQYPMVENNLRRSLVHRFPYSVLFRLIESDSIRILVIRHQRRHPRFGIYRR